MNNLPQNDWNRIRQHYRYWEQKILAEEKAEWAIDAYEWDNGMLTMTPIEAWLWADIRSCNGIFYPQYPVNGVFVDFANPRAKVAIECDGYAYHLDKGKDLDRDMGLMDLGWTVYRISGADCATEQAEDGYPSKAYRFVRMIVENHRIGRHHREKRSQPFALGRFAGAGA